MSQDSIRSNKRPAKSVFLVVGFFILLFSSSFAAAQKKVLVDKIQALVDGEPILYSAVKKKVTTGPLVSLSAYPATRSSSKDEQALQDAINMKIMIYAAEDIGLEASDEMIEQSIDQFLGRQNSTKAKLKQYLSSQGQDYAAYKEDFKDQILMQRYQQRTILPSVEIDEKEARTFYNNSGGLFAKRARLDLRQLVIRGGPSKVKRIYEALKTMPFTDAIQKYSDGPKGANSRIRNLDMQDMAPALQPAIASLKEGDYTPPLQTGAGAYIFYLEKRKTLSKVAFDKVKENIVMQLKQRSLLKKTDEWLEDQRTKTDLKIYTLNK